MARVYFSAWGNKIDDLDIPAYAMGKDGEFDSDLVAESIARKNGLHVCAGPQPQGTALKSGKPYEYHYSMTIGRPVKSGGFSPVAEVWFSIPV